MRIAILGCTKKKKQHAAPAIELYSASPYFRSCRDYALSYADRIWILSANIHHPVITDAHAIIEPYERDLTTLKPDCLRQWHWHVGYAITNEAGITDWSTVQLDVLAGKNYAEAVTANRYRWHTNWHGVTITTPLAGLSIGQRKQWLNAACAGVSLPEQRAS